MAHASGQATHALPGVSAALANVSITRCPTLHPAKAHRHCLVTNLTLRTGHASVTHLGDKQSPVTAPVLHAHVIRAWARPAAGDGPSGQTSRTTSTERKRSHVAHVVSFHAASSRILGNVQPAFATVDAGSCCADVRPGAVDPIIAEAAITLKHALGQSVSAAPETVAALAGAIWEPDSGRGLSRSISLTRTMQKGLGVSVRFPVWSIHIGSGGAHRVVDIADAAFGGGRGLPRDPTCFTTAWQRLVVPADAAPWPLSRFLLRHLLAQPDVCTACYLAVDARSVTVVWHKLESFRGMGSPLTMVTCWERRVWNPQ